MDRASRAVLDVARVVLEELDLDTVLDRVLESAQSLTQARYAALGVLDDSRTELARFLTRGIDAETRTRIGALPRGRGVLGELIEHPAPLRLADVGQHPRSYGLPHGHPPMRTFLGAPIVVEGVPFGNLYLTEKASGAGFSDADEEAIVILAEFAGVAIDHARRYAGAREDRDELARTVDALQATTQIARALGGETDLEVILELVAKRGRALVSARTLLIELVERDRLVAAAGAGELGEGIIGASVPIEGSLAGQALRTLTTQRVEDSLNRARFEEHGGGLLGLTAQAGLVVPLVFRGRAHGALLALDRLREGPGFTDQDVRLLEAFAASAATAVATAQSVASERNLQRLAAAEGERGRWARELHDETLQSLGALRLTLSSAARAKPVEQLPGTIAEATGQLESMIADLRSLIADLRPAALDELGLQAALDALAERTAGGGVAVDVHIDLAHEQGRAAGRHTPELEIAAYRIVQEALTNAVKHGHARRIAVEVQEDEAAIELSVRDDGEGFDPGAKAGGFGLPGMQERVELLEGSLSIDSAPGRGTVVRATLPTAGQAGVAAASAGAAS